ncbi:3-methyl-2-oxobutanoate hydroxymethyltransferase [Sulfodiicoccus acidiphilus]|uniref:3-methyl-2-oxobutanoate hydroxymethyltransferase n=1 Tax=Sulfodiicoccus acidiphilus TaxID=1670455 RepID=A0A348B6J5_9CREN|nr:3-methyl-2-oxobutanoate hydroxymethyltransferase [Sulfodiicoccus acidiphilus]BBD73797.1 3-methyl-2-oxobutanoate hydroxymethyltransferase [Sulfodiicoccus acidiphilus]GGU03657.1 3-methyl-2-oxobutanoate hydroxymethyltransferase [Sulfodiicoccus acidiphilus]
MNKKTWRDIVKKKGKEKITVLTAYDFPTAKALAETELDSILVGDSGGMNVLGYDSTLPVTMEDMEMFTRAVARARPPQLIVADMPFMSYEISVERALENAARLVRCGAEAVKIEGGKEVTEVVSALVRAGIPVMGHVGLTPQRVLRIGGYRTMGSEVDQLVEDAKALERAGAFSVVVENSYAEAARAVTESLSVPTICIGAGPHCDGQVLVIHDILGMSDVRPYFARMYRNLREEIRAAVQEYVRDVKSGSFPSSENYKERKPHLNAKENATKVT